MITAFIILTLLFSTFNPARGSSVDGRSKIGRGISTSVTGEISDSHCRFSHPENTEKSESCVHHCLGKNARLVLAEHDEKIIYTLDEEGQKQALKFAGQRVRVKGHVMETMIHVESIEAAD